MFCKTITMVKALLRVDQIAAIVPSVQHAEREGWGMGQALEGKVAIVT